MFDSIRDRMQQLTPHDLPAAACVCARAMRDNPVHVQVFGADPERRRKSLERFFSVVLSYIHRKGKLIGCHARGQWVGVLGMLPPGACRPGVQELPRLLPLISTAGSPARAVRLIRWLDAWRRNDPQEPHWHLGPLVVVPEEQGRGLGRRLIQRGLSIIDAHRGVAWLETDKVRNVRLYEIYDFHVTAERSVLGVRNWFMRRERRPDNPRHRRRRAR